MTAKEIFVAWTNMSKHAGSLDSSAAAELTAITPIAGLCPLSAPEASL